MTIFQKIKNFASHNKAITIIVFLIVFLIIIDFYLNMSHTTDYEAAKQSGNDKWSMVNDILQSYDKRITELEIKLNELQMMNQGGVE